MAIVMPVVFLLLLGILVGGLGMYRRHQVAALAHESARWASVRGNTYARATGEPMASSEEVLVEVVRPRAAGLNAERLSCELTWGMKDSTVAATVRYQWMPESRWLPITFSHTAEVPVTY